MQQHVSFIENACEKHHAKLIAVTKHRSAEEVNTLLSLGVENIGENKIQEAQEKFPQLKHPCKKHFIGHLQTNKVKEAVKLFDVIHSVDSEKLYLKLLKEAKMQNKTLDILFQINLSQEEQKHGFSLEEFEIFIENNEDIINPPFATLHCVGFMVMACKIEQCESAVRSIFKDAKQLSLQYQDIIGSELSMGMSQDYEIALEEGSSMIRIGSALWK